MTASSLNPDNIPLVKIDFMNRTHREEVELVVSLMEKIDQRSSDPKEDDEISQQLEQWLEHTKAHFERENELMQETGFPAYQVHSEEHEYALQGMQEVVTSWLDNKDIETLKEYVFRLWPNWFDAHVNSMDMVTAQFAVMNGYSEK